MVPTHAITKARFPYSRPCRYNRLCRFEILEATGTIIWKRSSDHPGRSRDDPCDRNPGSWTAYLTMCCGGRTHGSERDPTSGGKYCRLLDIDCLINLKSWLDTMSAHHSVLNVLTVVSSFIIYKTYFVETPFRYQKTCQG